jgi:ABC-type glycerol-3-phosphate transport system permease component
VVRSLAKFRWAIFLRMLPITVIPIVLVGLLARIYIQRNTIRTVQRNNQTAASVIAASADAYLRVPTGLVRQAARYLESTPMTQTDLQTYLQSIIVVRDSKLFATLSPEELRELQSVSDRTLKASQIFIAAAPVLAIYPFLQKYFMKGLVLGSVKG